MGLPRIDSSTSMLTRLRKSMAVGRILVSPSDITGNSSGKAAGLVHAALDPVRNHPEVSVARRQLGPRVTDSDHRPAIKQVGRKSLVLHPRTMNESISILEAEPMGGAQRLSVFIVVHGFDLAWSWAGHCRDERKHITTLALKAVMRRLRRLLMGRYRGIRRQVTGDLMK